MLSTLELLKKYDVPGPRYTSYPTVPAWSGLVGPSDFAQNLSAIHGPQPLSLYFHLPFCQQLCHFCGCMQVITKDHSQSKPYVDTLLKEIDLVIKPLQLPDKTCQRPTTNNQQPNVSQIHFGGGTPNFLQPGELSLLMEKIRANFHIRPDAEIAIEMHPRTSTKIFCENLKKEGFNRISLGVQDFDNDVQKLIHRFQTYDMTKDMLNHLRQIGFDHFNFDLIYGLPGQTLEKFAATLEKTLTLKPNRLAVYSYAHVPWVRPVQRAFKDTDLPTPETKLKLFAMALDFFSCHGFHLIGMDHFADENDELFLALKNNSIQRNFMGYSTRADTHQIGFGVSSISFVNGHYFQNFKKLPDYDVAIRQNKLATCRGHILSQDDHIRRDLITKLMCSRRVDIPEFEAKHNISFQKYFKTELARLKGFVRDDLVDLCEKTLLVTDLGVLTLRNIAMCFDRYLAEIKETALNPVFSRTV